MKITVNRLEALSLARDCDSIVSSNAPMDELKCLLLEASEDGRLTMAATNLEVALERRMKANVKEDGSLAINARLFAEMLSLLEGDMVTITGADGKQVEITGGSAGYRMPVMRTEKYPRMEIPFPEDMVVVTDIPAMAKRTVFAVTDDKEKPLFRCVNLVFSSDGLKAVSSDGYRLAAAKGASKCPASASMLIPASSLGKLARLVSNRDELHVGTTGKYVVFTKDGFAFSARLMEGSFIDSDMMLGGVQSSFTVLTDAHALYDAVSSVSVVAKEYGCLSLCFEGNGIRVSCEGEHASSVRELEVVALAGAPCGEYWYSHWQLAECLHALRGTLLLEVGQNGVLLMRTDDLTCLQMARRKPASTGKAGETASNKKAA